MTTDRRSLPYESEQQLRSDYDEMVIRVNELEAENRGLKVQNKGHVRATERLYGELREIWEYENFIDELVEGAAR